MQLTPSGALNSLFYTFDDARTAGLGVLTKSELKENATSKGAWQVTAPLSTAANFDTFERPLKETLTSAFLSKHTAASAGTHAAVTEIYDGEGNLTRRNFSNSEAQVFTWDEFGRLAQVSYRVGSTYANFANATGVDFTITYDPLGRRLRTVEQAVRVSSTGVVGKTTALPTVVGSWYDPQVEFLEVAVEVGDGTNKERYWKLYGPDQNGVRGGLHGIGGLEAFLRERDGQFTGMISDFFGNTPAWSTKPAGGSWTVTWNTVRVSSHGPLPGSTLKPLSTTIAPWEATIWQSRRQDPTGLYWFGARYYEPVSGRFISPDPLGHASSMSLYDYANGDPIAQCDPDGRTGTKIEMSNLKHLSQRALKVVTPYPSLKLGKNAREPRSAKRPVR